MLCSIHALYDDRLRALDGDIGHVEDFYVDDRKWTVRYVVANTGAWLSGRKVLIPPHVCGGIDSPDGSMSVDLTKAQIEGSPLIETHMPVSRVFEQAYYRHYGLPSYWLGDALWGLSSLPIIRLPAIPPPDAADEPSSEEADPHLHSTLAVDGCRIQATDGVIGHLHDLLMDDQDWSIRQFVVRTGVWFASAEVMVPAASVSRIVYEESAVYVDLTQEGVKASPPAR